jgi:hypothetical protein
LNENRFKACHNISYQYDLYQDNAIITGNLIVNLSGNNLQGRQSNELLNIHLAAKTHE